MHNHMLNIDILAQKSRLKDLNPGLKMALGVISLLLCVSSKSWIFYILIAFVMMIAVIWGSQVKLTTYIRLLSIPSLFIVLSGIAILIQISSIKLGFFNVPIANWYLSITRNSIYKTIIVILRAYASITCLFMISLTTPMSDIIYVCRRFKIPDIMIELMYLIYRYIMILFDIHGKMTIAADSRLGYNSLKNTYSSMKGIAMNLLSLSFKSASISFDAMESRGYVGKLNFYREEKPIHKKELICSIVYVVAIIVIFLLERK